MERFGDATDVVLREHVAMALRSQGFVLNELGRSKEALSAFEGVVERFGDAQEPALRQQVAEALVQQLSSPRNVLRLLSVWSAYRGAVDSDLSLRQSAGVFLLLKRIGTGRIVTRSLGDAAVSCQRCFASLLQLQPEETARLVGEAFGDAAAGATAAELLVAAGVTP